MNRAIPRLKYLFLALFAVSCAAIWAYQIFYVWPRDRCEARHAWWDPQTRICGTPIFLPILTGRPLGSKAPSPPAAKAAAKAGNAQGAGSRVAPGAQRTSPAP